MEQGTVWKAADHQEKGEGCQQKNITIYKFLISQQALGHPSSIEINKLWVWGPFPAVESNANAPEWLKCVANDSPTPDGNLGPSAEQGLPLPAKGAHENFYRSSLGKRKVCLLSRCVLSRHSNYLADCIKEAGSFLPESLELIKFQSLF